MAVPESIPLARFLAERSPSAESRLARRANHPRLPSPPRLLLVVDAPSGVDETSEAMSAPESPGSEGTSMLMSGNASLPALRRSSIGSLRSRVSRSSWSISTPGPIENGVPILPLPPGAPATNQGQRLRGGLTPPAIFECPFIDVHCHERFFNWNQWVDHSLSHFKDALPPTINRCVFCRRSFEEETGMVSWHNKLVCTAHHHLREGRKLEDAQPDFALHRYLWENSCITKAEWKMLCELRTQHLRRGNRGTGAVLGYGSLSPPTSPRDKDARCDQDMVVMTTNRGRERDRERPARKIRELEAKEEAEDED